MFTISNMPGTVLEAYDKPVDKLGPPGLTAVAVRDRRNSAAAWGKSTTGGRNIVGARPRKPQAFKQRVFVDTAFYYRFTLG